MIIISLGSNVTSWWGNSETTILRAFDELESVGIKILCRSRLYRTRPFGFSNQPDFINAAALIRTSRPPAVLLSILKMVEMRAGRQSLKRWGPRALDLDIIDYCGQIINWPERNKQAFKFKISPLILPHPGAEKRPFVLKPIMDIAPFWHHPVNRQTASQLLKRLRFAEMGQIIQTLA